MKISLEDHKVEMDLCRKRQLARRALRLPVEKRVGGPPFNDGFDEERQERAEAKRNRKKVV